MSLISINELREAQLSDTVCQKIRADIAKGEKSPYSEDHRGLLVRIAPTDRSVQIFVPVQLRPRALCLSHNTPVAGHPGVSRQYYTMRRTFYWPCMAADTLLEGAPVPFDNYRPLFEANTRQAARGYHRTVCIKSFHRRLGLLLWSPSPSSFRQRLTIYRKVVPVRLHAARNKERIYHRLPPPDEWADVTVQSNHTENLRVGAPENVARIRRFFDIRLQRPGA